MFCPRCRAPNSDVAERCSKCGALLKLEPKSALAPKLPEFSVPRPRNDKNAVVPDAREFSAEDATELSTMPKRVSDIPPKPPPLARSPSDTLSNANRALRAGDEHETTERDHRAIHPWDEVIENASPASLARWGTTPEAEARTPVPSVRPQPMPEPPTPPPRPNPSAVAPGLRMRSGSVSGPSLPPRTATPRPPEPVSHRASTFRANKSGTAAATAATRLSLSSPGRRGAAAAVDGFILFAFVRWMTSTGLLGSDLARVSWTDPDDLGRLLVTGGFWGPFLLCSVIAVAASTAAHAVWGRSLGKWLLGLELVEVSSGARPPPRRCLVRAITSLASAGFFAAGYLWLIVDRRARTWHDLVCRTVSIRTRRFPAKSPHGGRA